MQAVHTSNLLTLASRKKRSDFVTICGTDEYIAPEMHEEESRNAGNSKRRYSPAVDIRSLGVAIFGCAYGLPSKGAGGSVWCKEIVSKLGRDL